MIRFEGVSKIYSTDVVLKNISWEIKKGEKVGLVGSNGAGKSTQFKILIGEEEQTSGTIIKEGNPKIAHLKQEFDCNLNFSVRQELESSFKDIQIVVIFIAAALAIPSYWFFWTLAGGGGYNKRIKPIPNPNNNYSKPFPKDLLEP